MEEKNQTEVAHSTTSFTKISASTSGKISSPATTTQTSTSVGSIKIYPQFQGINFTTSSCNCAPPDVETAVGQNYVVEMVNLEGQIWAKNSTSVKSFSLASFYGAGSDSLSDPRILFDTISDRWFSSLLDITKNSVWLAVSNTSDPTSTWTIYQINFGDCADQPYIGVSNDKFVISGNDFGRGCHGSFKGAQYVILDKNALVSGSSTVASQFFGPNSNEFAVRPVQNLGTNSTLFMVSDDGTSGSNNLYLYEVDGTVPNTTTQKTTLTVNTINNPKSALQLGTGILLDTGDSRIQDAIWDDQKIWFTLNDGCIPSGDSIARSCVRLIELNATTNSVLQDFDIAKSGYYLFYPSLKIDANNNLNIVFGNSSSSNYPNIMFTVQGASDSPNTIEPLQLLKVGNAPVTVAVTNNVARYGDYFGSGVDPSNAAHVWVAAEYVPSSTEYWSTFIGNTNAVPVANAGQNQMVPSGSTVTLNGTTSSDIDGDSLTYSWTQIVGPTVTLQNPNSATPTFIAPVVSSNTLLIFQLVVGDGIVNSSPAKVSITVAPATCGVSFISGNPISYGTINPDSLSQDQTLVISNTGSMTGLLAVNGSNWMSKTTSEMLVNDTAYALTSGIPFQSKAQLQTSPQIIGNLFPGINNSTYWQLDTKLLSAFSGQLTQKMTFTISC